MPTAAIGSGLGIWPTTAVSTAPRIGTVAFESRIGSAIFSTRPWVRGRFWERMVSSERDEGHGGDGAKGRAHLSSQGIRKCPTA